MAAHRLDLPIDNVEVRQVATFYMGDPSQTDDLMRPTIGARRDYPWGGGSAVCCSTPASHPPLLRSIVAKSVMIVSLRVVVYEGILAQDVRVLRNFYDYRALMAERDKPET